jgi:cobyrinic acid a,c-diamide synthase
VQPFKCGPDYIDTQFHAIAARTAASVNLDTWMQGEAGMRTIYNRYAREAEVCLVEGVMGLFDGYDRDRGSSAEIASVLGIPVVLVVDAKSAAYSTAALLYGFTHFSPPHSRLSTPTSQLSTFNCQLSPFTIAGVIFNKVGSERHRKMLQEVCDDLQMECFGFLPKCVELEQGSRYLGLDFSEKMESEKLVALLEEHVGWQRLLAL